ncbi:MAG TPA: hypothetical protein VME70_10565 [Mycobacteriales bacterium]|nr:hypothetical protein [Mycobacteriales bacterium]
MTIARFDGADGTVDVQALVCFRRLRDFLDGLGTRLSATHCLTVEVADRRSLARVAEARLSVFGDQKPRVISSRFTRLPPGELVRVTVTTAAGG